MTPDGANPFHAIALVGATVVGSLLFWTLIALAINRYTRLAEK